MRPMIACECTQFSPPRWSPDAPRTATPVATLSAIATPSYASRGDRMHRSPASSTHARRVAVATWSPSTRVREVPIEPSERSDQHPVEHRSRRSNQSRASSHIVCRRTIVAAPHTASITPSRRTRESCTACILSRSECVRDVPCGATRPRQSPPGSEFGVRCYVANCNGQRPADAATARRIRDGPQPLPPLAGQLRRRHRPPAHVRRPGRQPAPRLRAQAQQLRPRRRHRARRRRPPPPLRAPRGPRRRPLLRHRQRLLRRRQHPHARHVVARVEGQLLQVHQRDPLRDGGRHGLQRPDLHRRGQRHLRRRRLRARPRLPGDLSPGRRQLGRQPPRGPAPRRPPRHRRPHPPGRQAQGPTRPRRRVLHHRRGHPRQAGEGLESRRRRVRPQQVRARGDEARHRPRRPQGRIAARRAQRRQPRPDHPGARPRRPPLPPRRAALEQRVPHRRAAGPRPEPRRCRRRPGRRRRHPRRRRLAVGPARLP